jgi:aspartate racemase
VDVSTPHGVVNAPTLGHIGIAAVTAEGAALVYRRICATAGQRLGEYRHPEITLHTHSFAKHVFAGPDRLVRWAQLMLVSASKLHNSGADFMICPSNSPHEVYDRVSDELPLPWLHIAAVVRHHAQALSLHRLLLLGTRYTIESSFYDSQILGSGIELRRPATSESAKIDDIIRDELVHGVVTSNARDYVGRVIQGHAHDGVDGVILGCTELSLLIDDALINRSPVLLDSAILLADAAVDRAVGALGRPLGIMVAPNDSEGPRQILR